MSDQRELFQSANTEAHYVLLNRFALLHSIAAQAVLQSGTDGVDLDGFLVAGGGRLIVVQNLLADRRIAIDEEQVFDGLDPAQTCEIQVDAPTLFVAAGLVSKGERRVERALGSG